MSHRSKILLRKKTDREVELRVLSNPLLQQTTSSLIESDDYQAPHTAFSLSPNSKWLIVRNNLHKIRSWGGARRLSNVDARSQDWYLFFQMRRELRRAQAEISTIQSRPDFAPIRHFHLPTSEKHFRRVNVSHVQSDEAIYYPSFSAEPIVLQSLLFYFTKECFVPYQSVFRSFLTDVCSIISQDRQRLNRVVVFRRIALVLTILVSIFLAMMFFSLILSAWTTTNRLDTLYRTDPDGGIGHSSATANFPSSISSL